MQDILIDGIDESMAPGTEITISDREVYETAKSLGYDVDMSVLDSSAKLRSAKSSSKNGVNKIVWRKGGGFDLYVSINTLFIPINNIPGFFPKLNMAIPP